MPNDQPTSHTFGRFRSWANASAAATSSRSPSPLSNAPSLRPASLAVPRVLKRSTAMSASAGSRNAALRYRCESIMPPCVGSGCRQISVALGAFSGSASSPTSRSPSAVVNVTGSRRAGSIVLARISVLITENRARSTPGRRHDAGMTSTTPWPAELEPVRASSAGSVPELR
ncbi:hypothetical protein [Kutzneria kofuensis]|uniref:hypothetical protein n=1 Tax=Kutzneria kofuensis TaxID=103725 RepID=UPI0031E9BCFD